MGAPAFVHYDEKARRTADDMIATEARHIAQRKAQEQACKCKDGMFTGPA
jgi:sulfane dehydrogenase subunit SoxC